MDQQERETFWRGHVDTFLRERGSQRDYCDRHGISARELRAWRTRFYGAVRQLAHEAPAPVEPKLQLREFAYPLQGEAKEASAIGDLAGTLVVRRRWTAEQKRQLVWQGLNSGQSLAAFARRHGIHASVAHRWLKQFARPVLTVPEAGAAAAFAAVHIAAPPAVPGATGPAPTVLPTPGFGNGLIEIELAGGRRVRVGPDVDAGALHRVLAVLENPA